MEFMTTPKDILKFDKLHSQPKYSVSQNLNTGILQFKKETIANYSNSKLDVHIADCQHYALCDKGQSLGGFYFGIDYSLCLLNDTILIVKCTKRGLKMEYQLQNFNNNAIVGQISISKLVFSEYLKVSLEIIHKEPYTWKVIKATQGFSFFTVKTWSHYLATLFNSQEILTIKWDYIGNQIGKYRLKQIPVEGEIDLNNRQNHFLIFAGLFLAEMQLQMNVVD
jgi:hypothetical protein